MVRWHTLPPLLHIWIYVPLCVPLFWPLTLVPAECLRLCISVPIRLGRHATGCTHEVALQRGMQVGSWQWQYEVIPKLGDRKCGEMFTVRFSPTHVKAVTCVAFGLGDKTKCKATARSKTQKRRKETEIFFFQWLNMLCIQDVENSSVECRGISDL